MKLEEIVSKNKIAIGGAVVGAGVLMTLTGFFMPPPLVKFMPLVSGLAGAGAVYYLIDEISKKILPSLKEVQKNAVKVAEGHGKDISPLSSSPEEIDEINNSISKISARIEETLIELQHSREIHTRDLDALLDMTQITSDSKEYPVRFAKTVELMMNYLEMPHYFLFRKDDPANKLVRANPNPKELSHLGTILLKDVGNDSLLDGFKNRQPGFLENIVKDLRLSLKDEIRNWADKNQIKNIFFIPLLSDSEPVGLILVKEDKMPCFTGGQKAILRLGCEMIGEFYKSESRNKDKSEKLSLLEVENEIYKGLIELSRFDDLCKNFLQSLSHFIPMEWGSIAIPEKGGDKYRLVSVRFSGDAVSLKRSYIPIEGSGVTWVQEHKKPWVEEDLNISKPFSEDEFYVFNRLSARIIIPLFSPQQKFVGALSVASRTPAVYSQKDVRTLTRIATLLAAVVENSSSVSTLHEEIDQLKKKNQNLEEYYTKLGNSLKHPLHLIEKTSHTIRENYTFIKQPHVKASLEEVMEQIKNLSNALEKLMNYSRGISTKIDVEHEEFLFVELLQEALWEFQETIVQKKLSIKQEIPRILPEIIADRQKLRICLKEILSNACRFTPSGGTITIKVNLLSRLWLKDRAGDFFPEHYARLVDRSVDQLLINISDTGPGIPPEIRKTLFYTAKESPEKLSIENSYSGMGLPLVRQMIEAHQGFVWVGENSNQGTRIFFNLPQYGKDWESLKSLLQKEMDASLKQLSSLSVIAVGLMEYDEIAGIKGEEDMQKTLKDIERRIKQTQRDPHDTVRRYYDDKSILLVTHADIETVKSIKFRLWESLNGFVPQPLKKSPTPVFASVTYPDEALTADEMLKLLDTNLSQELGKMKIAGG